MVVKASPIIFIVDDDASVRRALKRLIVSAGLPVKTFASGEEFLSSGPPTVPGCVILDVRMPGLSGLDLQSRLAERGCTLPVIFMTAHEDDQLRSRAIEAGAADFLYKPLDDEVLLEAINTAIEG